MKACMRATVSSISRLEEVELMGTSTMAIVIGESLRTILEGKPVIGEQRKLRGR